MAGDWPISVMQYSLFTFVTPLYSDWLVVDAGDSKIVPDCVMRLARRLITPSSRLARDNASRAAGLAGISLGVVLPCPSNTIEINSNELRFTNLDRTRFRVYRKFDAPCDEFRLCKSRGTDCFS